MAEVESFNDFIRGKTIFVTGATGFVGKVFVEKILRVQPEIKRLYLLIRAPNSDLATQRLHNKVFGKELFKVLKEKWGADFRCFISDKVVAVAGDVSLQNLGIKDKNMFNQMLKELDIIVHTAATTNFNERYDVAMSTNTMGAFHIVSFAKNCHKIEIVLHLSTAYVCGEAEGVILEKPLHGDQMKKGSAKLDIKLEKQLIEDKLTELRMHETNEEEIKSVMKSFGLARANVHGWPNTYVFTKAMGEMILMKMKGTLPFIIIRPTMIISTQFEPFPGWIEGFRTIDVIVFHYVNGTMKSLVGIGETILDVIPVDMVVNFMIAASMAISKGLSKNLVYHVGSSLRNPFTLNDLVDDMYYYFTKYPFVDEYGKTIVVTKKLTISSHVVIKIEDFLKPFSMFKGIFDDKNAESLRMVTKRVASMDGRFDFGFDPKSINWKDYMMNIHFPGLMKHSIKKLSIGSKM
ncbi:hypothetical protein PHAVU_011G180400 [Phaseolus vulgaris]